MRTLPIFGILLLIATTASAQRGPRGAFPARYPFDQWLAEGPKSQIKWNVKVLPTELSLHQRLQSQIRVEVDGGEIEKRQGRGQMVMLMRVADLNNGRWQTLDSVDLTRFRKNTHYDKLSYTVSMFVLPGKYRLDVAICDSKTLDHSVATRPFEITGLKNDALPESWKGFPAVEFLTVMGTPDSWYLPYSRPQLNLPIATKQPVHIDLLVNTTPTQFGMSSVRVFNRNMSVLVPAIRALSAIDPHDGTVALSVLDLSRRRIAYQQENARLPDWRSMRKTFGDAAINTGTIDIDSLEGRRSMVDYFRREVQRHIIATTESRVIVVLSATAYYDKQQTPPLPALPDDPNLKVFYIRWDFPQEQAGFGDDLEHTLKPFGVRTFAVTAPEQFRRAMAAIVAEIAKF